MYVHCSAGCSRRTQKEVKCPTVGKGQGNYDALMEHLAVKHDHYEDYIATGREVFSEKENSIYGVVSVSTT